MKEIKQSKIIILPLLQLSSVILSNFELFNHSQFPLSNLKLFPFTLVVSETRTQKTVFSL